MKAGSCPGRGGALAGACGWEERPTPGEREEPLMKGPQVSQASAGKCGVLLRAFLFHILQIVDRCVSISDWDI